MARWRHAQSPIRGFATEEPPRVYIGVRSGFICIQWNYELSERSLVAAEPTRKAGQRARP